MVRARLNKYRNDGIAIVMLASLIIAVFRWVPTMYFQQDEWYSMGQALLAKTDPTILFHLSVGAHVTPVALAWFNMLYYFFGLHPIGYSIVSVCIHIAVTILFYMLLRKCAIGIVPSGIGAAFFALNFTSSQVVTWISASQFGGLSVLLFLAGCLVWITNSSKPSALKGSVVSALLLCAILGKEDLVTGYVIIFAVSCFFVRKRTLSFVPIIIPFAVWLLLYACIRLFGIRDTIPQNTKTIFDGISYMASIPRWMGNIFITHDSLRIAIQKLFASYTVYFPIIDDDPSIKTMSAVMSFLWYLWFFVTASVKKMSFKMIVLFPALIGLSMLPYYFSYSSGLESRHFYIAVLITGGWIAWYLDWMLRKKCQSFFTVSAVYVFLFIFISVIANQPRDDLLALQTQRRIIVSQMQMFAVPTPGTVVYFIDNGASFPFQSGVGQMLLVLQSRMDETLVPYFRTNFLYGMYEQGYRKIGQKGFGYFHNYQILQTEYQKGSFAISSVRAYHYNRELTRFTDITEQVTRSLQDNTL